MRSACGFETLSTGSKRPGSAPWHYRESGIGRTLILLHGIGMSHAAWSAVIPYLSQTRRVIAFDIAGFGSTPPLADRTIPNVPNLVDSLEVSIRKIGVDVPVDVAGNSLGGYMTLEAAKRGLARSVVAISPAGLWSTHEPFHVKYVFGMLRFLAKSFPYLLKRAMHVSLVRELALAVPVSVASGCMSEQDAIRLIDDLAESKAFEETFDNTHSPFCGRDITVPVTVAFGDRDCILSKGSRRRDGLPAHARWIEMPNWGHVPMWVDPVGVSQLILQGTK